jgi:hypothetical protein
MFSLGHAKKTGAPGNMSGFECGKPFFTAAAWVTVLAGCTTIAGAQSLSREYIRLNGSILAIESALRGMGLSPTSAVLEPRQQLALTATLAAN